MMRRTHETYLEHILFYLLKKIVNIYREETNVVF